MEEVLSDFTVPADWTNNVEMIKVIGVGGGGCNAVSYMFKQHVEGCTFIVCNTDAQALQQCDVPTKIALGQGLGAGMDAIKARNCALESEKEISELILGDDTKMLFVTAGMGGGTGTGAAPVIAKMAKEKGILTVGVVTLPFKNERNGSYARAVDGVRELQKNVDSLLIIDNEKLAEVYRNELIQKGFPKSDEILATAVRGITEIISRPGFKNVDFEDVKTTMKNSGMALLGSGVGTGENRLEQAVEQALNSPLLYDFELRTSRRALVNLTVAESEQGITFAERDRLNELINERIGDPSKYKEGIVYVSDPEWGDKVRVTIIATGFKMTKLTEVIGENRGNIIDINDDYVYNPEDGECEEEEDFTYDDIEKIGFNTIANQRKFDFSEKPLLYGCSTSEMQALETKPAIRRQPLSQQ
ncbi:MAG: cell division protein FtsZ [Bacteroidales bacterium]|nr:cell division protein FtsZ [Bacteroidales bacterium]MCR4566054.1 cell division protein FtsZ [Bacteroidales bacterium]